MVCGVIGAGKVAHNITVALYQKNYNFKYVISNKESSATKLATRIDAQVVELNECVLDADVIFITVPDDKIAVVSEQITAFSTFVNKQLPLKNKIFVHMSGAKTADELTLLKNLGALVVALHPMQTFSDFNLEQDYSYLESTYFTFEGDKEAFDICQKIVDDLGAKLIEIDAKNKALYHASLCISSNFFVTILKQAIDILSSVGFERHEAAEAIKPLVKKTFDNCFTKLPENSLTGPIARGDLTTVSSHLDCIKDKNLYIALAKETAQLAYESQSIDKSRYAELLNILEEKSNEY